MNQNELFDWVLSQKGDIDFDIYFNKEVMFAVIEQTCDNLLKRFPSKSDYFYQAGVIIALDYEMTAFFNRFKAKAIYGREAEEVFIDFRGHQFVRFNGVIKIVDPV